MLYVTVTEPNGKTTTEWVIKLDDAQKKLLGIIEKANLLTRDNYNLIAKGNLFIRIMPRVEKLINMGQMTTVNLQFILTRSRHPDNAYFFMSILESLHPKGLLTEELLEIFRNYPVLSSLSHAIFHLDSANLLTADNLTAILKYKYIDSINKRTDHGIFLLGEILGGFAKANVLNQTHLDLILTHPFPFPIQGIIEKLYNTDVSLTDYLPQLIRNKNENALDLVNRSISLLDKSITRETFDLAFKGYFHDDEKLLYGKSGGVQFLIATNLFTPLNVNFVDKGTFVYFGNTSKPLNDDGWYIRARALNPAFSLDDLQKYDNPRVTLPKLNSPVQSALNNLFNMTTTYLYQSKKNDPHTPVCHELLQLQEHLFKAYTQYEKDNNHAQLNQAFKTHIEASKAVIEKTYSFTEKLAELFNQLLNAVQSIVTLGKKDQRPWGRFFAHGERTFVAADLLLAAKNEPVRAEVIADQTQEIPAPS